MHGRIYTYTIQRVHMCRPRWANVWTTVSFWPQTPLRARAERWALAGISNNSSKANTDGDLWRPAVARPLAPHVP
eukprot:4593205-Lingulodinium_polyedra.AAC.1